VADSFLSFDFHGPAPDAPLGPHTVDPVPASIAESPAPSPQSTEASPPRVKPTAGPSPVNSGYLKAADDEWRKAVSSYRTPLAHLRQILHMRVLDHLRI